MNALQRPLPLDLPPMQAEAVDALPSGREWQYEPKYDGFRCIAHRHGPEVHLQSRNGKALARYFPEIARGVLEVEENSFVLDGELVIPDADFEALQLRLHPAESRIRLLSQQSTARFIAFDILARGGTALLDRPLSERRRELEALIARADGSAVLRLGEATEDEAGARRWLGRKGLDGVVAKQLDLGPGLGSTPHDAGVGVASGHERHDDLHQPDEEVWPPNHVGKTEQPG